MTHFSDEQLGAFADGELTEADARAIRESAERDPELAARIAELIRQRLEIQTAFNALLADPAPQRLVEAATPTADILPFRERAGPPRGWVTGMGMAASLMIGVGVGVFGDGLATGGRSSPEPDAALIYAGGEVAATLVVQALNSTRSGIETQVGSGMSFRARTTFRDAEGRVCRQFNIATSERATDGVACHGAGRWTVAAMTASAVRTDGYQLATGGDDPVIESSLEKLGAGAPLDAAAEAAALATTRIRP